MNVKEITKQLEAASVELPGLPGRWVMAAVVRDALELGPTRRSMGGDFPNSVRIWMGRPKKRVRFLWMPDCEAMVMRRAFNPNRLWTSDDNRELESIYGSMPIEKVAASIGRTPKSVYRQVKRMGVNLHNLMLDRDNLLTMQNLADLFGVSLCRVRSWCRRGMPRRRIDCYKKMAVADLREVRDWLKRNPSILLRIRGPMADKLGLDVVQRINHERSVVIDLKRRESAA